MEIYMMGDHYALVVGGVVIGTIERSQGFGNEGKWGVHFLNGGNPVNYVPLHMAMREARKDWHEK